MSWKLIHTKKDLAAACKGRRILMFHATDYGEMWIRVTKKELFHAMKAYLKIERGMFQVDTKLVDDNEINIVL